MPWRSVHTCFEALALWLLWRCVRRAASSSEAACTMVRRSDVVSTIAIAMEDVVTLRLGKSARGPGGEWTVRASVLRCHSSVLDGIIADGAPTEEGKVLTMDGVTVLEVETFLALAHNLSHRANERSEAGLNFTSKDLSMDKIVSMTWLAMPMIHKYDAAGMLKLIRAAVNAKPCMGAILAILKHDDSMDWMKSDTLDFLMKGFLSWFNEGKVSVRKEGVTALTAARETLEDMPPSVVNAFLLYVMSNDHLEIRDLRQQSKSIFSKQKA